MKAGDLLRWTNHGLYCVPGDFYIDPHHAVPRAVITHAHSDHARAGHGQSIAHPVTLALLRRRLHYRLPSVPLPYGQHHILNGVTVSLHPAGHIPGSAQVRLECNGFVAVVTGDYKLEPDGLTIPFEQLRCNLFVTESTFALPIFRWRPQVEVFDAIVRWHEDNAARGRTSVLMAYALGKAQRLVFNISPRIREIIVHRSITALHEALLEEHVALPACTKLNATRLDAGTAGALIIAPSQGLREGWLSKLGPYTIGVVSGWMALRTLRERRGAERGFVLSDHADWPGLERAIMASGAEQVLVSHGYSDVLVRWLRDRGITAGALEQWRPGSAGGVA